jgi:hypothetical protein
MKFPENKAIIGNKSTPILSGFLVNLQSNCDKTTSIS